MKVDVRAAYKIDRYKWLKVEVTAAYEITNKTTGTMSLLCLPYTVSTDIYRHQNPIKTLLSDKES